MIKEEIKKDILKRYFIHKQSYVEISKNLGINRVTISNIINSYIRKIKENELSLSDLNLNDISINNIKKKKKVTNARIDKTQIKNFFDMNNHKYKNLISLYRDFKNKNKIDISYSYFYKIMKELNLKIDKKVDKDIIKNFYNNSNQKTPNIKSLHKEFLSNYDLFDISYSYFYKIIKDLNTKK
ncbi:sigma factor-like helix-turn-helix DNA-binding protein [uncultured Clostridium sp.]|uniref:sigma factor-like helix-turn-helix DNA-binding protein n=1 Tax=uncultured Clostridium sp. TaxID=59620 RepID=UPI002583D60B|nr:sigma factor-like helix-turn-helix DNA-binding protein [uncultured Clostridium sp.]MDU1349269.1 sigma factor-like helix-turn-helix DNA-binding protein [Clostridium argentinense]